MCSEPNSRRYRDDISLSLILRKLNRQVVVWPGAYKFNSVFKCLLLHTSSLAIVIRGYGWEMVRNLPLIPSHVTFRENLSVVPTSFS